MPWLSIVSMSGAVPTLDPRERGTRLAFEPRVKQRGAMMSRVAASEQVRGVVSNFDDPFHVPLLFDYTATLLWAISGALIAARRGYDYTGIVTVAVISATGGGLIRDGIFLQDGTPAVLRSPVYLLLVGFAALVVLLGGRYLGRIPSFSSIVSLVDAFGVGAYALVGLQLSLARGLSISAAVLVGVVNAIGGGLLRDVVLRREPDLFKPATPLAMLSFVSCFIFLGLTRLLQIGDTLAGWIAVTLIFIIRMLVVRFDIRTIPQLGFEPTVTEDAAASEPASHPTPPQEPHRQDDAQ